MFDIYDFLPMFIPFVALSVYFPYVTVLPL